MRRGRSVLTAVVGVIGELMFTAGVLVLLFVVYLLWGTGVQTAAAQNDLRGQLTFEADGQRGGDDGERGADADDPSSTQEAESRDPGDREFGDAYGIIRIPRFGDDWEWVIVEGVEDNDLRRGPGRYPDNAHAGQPGNFAVAAHRAGHGEPFAKFPDLYAGDIVEIETAAGTFTYRLDDAPDGDSNGNRIEITDTWVVDPVPGEPRDTEPTEARITLTTCWPRFGSSHRMYATGVLVEFQER